MMCQIGDDFPSLEISDDGANREAQDDVLGASSIAIGSLPLASVLGTVDTRIAIVDQRIDVAIRDRVDAAAASTIPPVRPAAGHELLPTETGDSIPAIAGMDLDHSFVDEFHVCSRGIKEIESAGVCEPDSRSSYRP